MTNPIISQGAKPYPRTCETNDQPKDVAAKGVVSAGLTPADRENMLSVFPEMSERILAAARTEGSQTARDLDVA